MLSVTIQCSQPGLEHRLLEIEKKYKNQITGFLHRLLNNFEVQLTLNYFSFNKIISFSNYFSEQIISTDKIPGFLPAFKVVIPVSHIMRHRNDNVFKIYSLNIPRSHYTRLDRV